MSLRSLHDCPVGFHAPISQCGIRPVPRYPHLADNSGNPGCGLVRTRLAPKMSGHWQCCALPQRTPTISSSSLSSQHMNTPPELPTDMPRVCFRPLVGGPPTVCHLLRTCQLGSGRLFVADCLVLPVLARSPARGRSQVRQSCDQHRAGQPRC